MKAVLLTGLRQMELRELPEPVLLNDNEVLLKTSAVGICGSDIHYYTDGRIGDQIIDFPFTIGHECSATVVNTGTRVKSLAPGDLVAVEPAVSCGQCDQCLSGRPHTCRNLLFMGCPGQMQGCLSEYIIMPEANCFKLPDNITPVQAALVEPLSIGAYAAKFIRGKTVKTVGILGAGPIGLCVMTALKSAGINNFFVTDKIPSRLKAAESMGAEFTALADDPLLSENLRQKEPHLLDAVFECCGKQEALDQAVDLLKPGGSLIIVGIPAEERISFNISRIRRKEITIFNVRRQNHSVKDAIRLVQDNPQLSEILVTHVVSPEKTKEAFDMVTGYKDGVIKAVVKFS